MIKEYTPSKTIKEFMADDSLIRGIIGPFSSGKSVGSVIEIIRRACLQKPNADGIRKTRVLVVRNTAKQLADTTIKTFLEWVPDGKAGLFFASSKTFHFGMSPAGTNRAEKTYFKLPDGTRVHCEVMFRALDRPDQMRNLLSMELTYAWINEFREIPFEVLMNLIGRIGRYPAKSDVPCTWKGVIMDSNPPSEDSPYVNLFERGMKEAEALAKKYGVPVPKARVFKQPSGLSEEAENVEWIEGGKAYYVNMLATAKADGRDKSWIDVHVHGKYGMVIDGRAVFANSYNDNIHVVHGKLIPDTTKAIGIGLDFGICPTAVFGQLNAKGQWTIFGELQSDGGGIVEFSRDLKRYCSEHYPNHQFVIYGDPAGAQRSQVDARSSFDILRRDGWKVVPSEMGIQTRVESVRAGLNRMVGGEPGFLMADACYVLRQGFRGGYHYRRIKVSEETYDTKPDKNSYSHCLVGETKVSIRNGSKNIKDIKIGDKVKTPMGYQKVTATMSRTTDEIYELTFSNGGILHVTGEHPIKTTNGFVRVDNLSKEDLCLSIAGRSSIKNQKDTTKRLTINTCIDLYGSLCTERLKKEMSSTISMATRPITELKTYNQCLVANMDTSTGRKETLRNSGELCLTPESLPQSGMALKLEENGTVNMGKKLGLAEKSKSIPVIGAEILTKPRLGQSKRGTAPQTVSQRHEKQVEKTTLTENVLSARDYSRSTNIQKQKHAVTLVNKCIVKGKKKVYDLTVENEHVFYANGILVSNCHDALQYLMAKFEVPSMRKGMSIAFPDNDSVTKRRKTIKTGSWNLYK